MDYGVQVDEYKGKTVGVYGGKFFPFHEGHLSFVLKAQSMVDVLFVVVHYDEEYERGLCEGTRFEYVPYGERERWITEIFKDFPNIRVFSQYEHRSLEHMTDPLVAETYRELKETVGGRVDIVFSNTHEYDDYFAQYLPGSEHVVFYENRDVVDVSATKIRENGVYDSWCFLPEPVRKFYTKRVAFCGIESVGKTHLSTMIAAELDTYVQNEYGRVFYDDIGGYGSIAKDIDFVDIAVGHCYLLNEKMKLANKVLISDTDLIYTQYYYEQAFGVKNNVLDVMIKDQADKIDLYLYIVPHNEHVLDGTRAPVSLAQRELNHQKLLGLYESYGVNLVIVDEPDRDDRFSKVLGEVSSLVS